jgi:predicted ABC-type ATPase
LSGSTLPRQIKEVKLRGYKVHLFFVSTFDVKVNIERVKLRKKQGGHDVPVSDIRRRYKRSHKNLLEEYVTLCDTIEVYSTLERDPSVVALCRKGDWSVLNRPLWKKLTESF